MQVVLEAPEQEDAPKRQQERQSFICPSCHKLVEVTVGHLIVEVPVEKVKIKYRTVYRTKWKTVYRNKKSRAKAKKSSK